MTPSTKHMTQLMTGLLLLLVASGPTFTYAADGDEFDLLIQGSAASKDTQNDDAPPPPPAMVADDDQTPPADTEVKSGKKARGTDFSRRHAARRRSASGDRNRRGGKGMGKWGPAVDSEALMKFLNIHEPTLAAKLEDLQSDNPRQFKRRARMIGKLYSPVIQEIQHDPDMAALSLRQIRQNLAVHAAAETLKDTPSDAAAAAELRENLSALFDTVVQAKQLRHERFAAELASRGTDEDRPDMAKDDDRMDRPGRADGQGKGRRNMARDDDDVPVTDDDRPGRHRGGRGRNASERREMLADRLAQQADQIESWKDHKEQIIDQRYDQIVSGQQPFPWGR